MAEVFSNKLARAVGVVNSSAAGAIGITTNKITGISTSGVTVGDLVDNQNYIAGTTISSIGVGQVVVNRDSTNTSSTTSQNVKFLKPTTIYTSPGSTKTILIGGTFANNTNGQVGVKICLATITDESAGALPIYPFLSIS